MRKLAIAGIALVVLVAGLVGLYFIAYPLTPDPPGVDLAELPGPWTNHFVELPDRVNGNEPLRVHYLEAGSPDAPTVILLHGFPDLSYGWRYVIPELAADYHVYAPTLRGYGATDHPESGYDLQTLAGDLAAFIDHLGGDPVQLIAHDWGASIGWELAIQQPEKLATLTILNVAHPLAFAELVETSEEQQKYRGFVALLVSPFAPRYIAGLSAEQRCEVSYRDELVDDSALREEDVPIYHAAFNTPEELRSPLAYYKSLVKDAPAIGERARAAGKVKVPVLALWGAEDSYMLAPLAELSCKHVNTCEYEVFDGAGHWLQWEKPTEVVVRWREFTER